MASPRARGICRVRCRCELPNRTRHHQATSSPPNLSQNHRCPRSQDQHRIHPRDSMLTADRARPMGQAARKPGKDRRRSREMRQTRRSESAFKLRLQSRWMMMELLRHRSNQSLRRRRFHDIRQPQHHRTMPRSLISLVANP